MKNYKVGIVGCGRIAKRHADLLSGEQILGMELVAVCDTDNEKAKFFGKKYNLAFYDQLEMMLAKHELDVVTVLTESGSHFSAVMFLAGCDVHVIVEKPMALKVADARKMADAFEGSGKRLFTVKQNRFNKPVLLLKDAMNQNHLGKPMIATARVRWCREQSYYDQAAWRGTWKMDGGVLANQAIHHVDLLQWLVGDVHSVFAKSSTFMANIEAEDTLVAVLQFKNGALGSIEASTAVRPKDLEGSISIIGSHGSAEIGGFAANKLLHFNTKFSESGKNFDKDEHSSNPPNVYGYGHKGFYDHVVMCLRNDQSSMLEGEEGIKSVKIVNAIYQSIETKEEIILDETDFKSRLGNC